MLLLVAYGQRDPNAFFLTQHIRQSFSKDISDSMSIQQVFNWANTTLLSNLFGEYPGQVVINYNININIILIHFDFVKPMRYFKTQALNVCM